MPKDLQILYIEDDMGIARLLQKRLSRYGYSIEIASDGTTGVERCVDKSYDVIIVDYNLPGLNGLQVLEQLTIQNTFPPTIMLTGTGSERVAVEALKLGASDYLVKDIDGVYLELLPTVIEQSLAYERLREDKQRAEEALRSSEAQFRGVVEQSHDGIVLVDERGKIVEWNKAEENITGINRAEALGQYIWDITYQTLPQSAKSDAARERFKQMFHGLWQADRATWVGLPLEYEIERPDGTTRVIQAVKFLIEDGHRLLVGDITRDITERKRMEEALRESEERFRMLFEEAPDPYFVNDLSGNLIDCNRAVEPLLGMNANELIGKNFLEMGVFASDQIEKITSLLNGLQENTPPNPQELLVTRPDSKEVVVDLRVIPIQNKGETQILGIGRDITWRKEAEVRMKTYIEQLENLHKVDTELSRELAVDHVQKFALENMVRLSEASAGSVASISKTEILTVYSVGYPENLNRQYSLNDKSIVARVAQKQKAEWIQDVTTDPDYVAVSADTRSQIAIPLLSQERLVGVVSLETDQPDNFNHEIFEFLQLIATRIAIAMDNAQLFDRTKNQLMELRNLYEQVQQLEQAKSDMIGIVSHDLRNPLSTVSTSTHLLGRSMAESITDKQEQYLAQINHAIDRMKTLTTDVLSLENIERLARDELSVENVDFSDLVQNISDYSQIQAEQKNQQMSLSLSDSPIYVKGYTIELQQAVSNIISNAIKYTPVGGKIDISVKYQQGTVRFEVKDNGYGVPDTAKANLFQAFERVRNEETQGIEGTGLGLYIVKKTVEHNNGEIVFSSEYGRGSVFGFTLPVEDT